MRWVQTWISAYVPNNMAHKWRAVLGIFLRKKPNAEDVKPILIRGSLMFLLGICLQCVVQAKAKKLLVLAW